MVFVPSLLTLCVGTSFVSHGYIRNHIASSIGTPTLRQNVFPNDFVLYSEKRHKEAMLGRKFTSVGTSSTVKHFRIVGRGGGLPRLHKVSGAPTKRIDLPARRCMLLGKMDNTKARKISHSGKRSHRHQKLNLHWRRIWCISRGHYVRLRLSMKGLKTIKRLGLEEAARRFHLNLNNPKLFAGYANLPQKSVKQPVNMEEEIQQTVRVESLIGS